MADNPTNRTAKKEKALLDALRNGLSISSASRAAGIHRSTYYAWRETHPDFATAADDAIEEGTDGLEDEAMRRAMTSSDTMLIFMLKGRRGDKYRENSTVRHEGNDGGPLTLIINRPGG